MKWKALITAPYMQPDIDRFRAVFAENDVDIVVPPVKERLEEEELLPWVGDVDGVICGDDRFTETVLKAAPRLKVISKWGTGIDAIDLDACLRRGVRVINTPNAFTEPVADSVLGYVLCFARNLLDLSRSMKAGIWHKIPGRSLRECTLGIVGVGNVGKAAARRARAFGMTLLGHDPVDMPSEFLAATGIRMVTLTELLAHSDFISLNCDLNPTSRHLIGSREFSQMKHSAVVINTARGPIIDEGALVSALENVVIAGAALDVYEKEPLPADSPLRKMDNVLLAPHNANSSHEAWEFVHKNSMDSLFSALKGHGLCVEPS